VSFSVKCRRVSVVKQLYAAVSQDSARVVERWAHVSSGPVRAGPLSRRSHSHLNAAATSIPCFFPGVSAARATIGAAPQRACVTLTQHACAAAYAAHLRTIQCCCLFIKIRIQPRKHLAPLLTVLPALPPRDVQLTPIHHPLSPCLPLFSRTFITRPCT
jgi:hypothetical protein